MMTVYIVQGFIFVCVCWGGGGGGDISPLQMLRKNNYWSKWALASFPGSLSYAEREPDYTLAL